MASIEQRILRLEETRTIRRTLSDAERAVRIMRLQPGTPAYEGVWAIINRRVHRRNPSTPAFPK